MSHLHKYVPECPDSFLHCIPCHGDGLSVERMTDAKRARSADLTPVDRLEGLLQTPQEFHHRGLMLQIGHEIIKEHQTNVLHDLYLWYTYEGTHLLNPVLGR